jgi:hypothetical protein
MSLKRIERKLILIILVILAFNLGYVVLYRMSRGHFNNILVYGSGNFNLYNDPACTIPATFINWGSCAPGQVYQAVLYMFNDQDSNVTLSSSATNWNPSSSQNYITESWNYTQTTTMLPHSVEPVKFVLTVDPNISQITAFSFDISVFVSSNVPGYFAINGIVANNSTFLRVMNPTLTLTYAVNSPGITYSGSGLTAYVNVMNGSTQIASIALTPDSSTFNSSEPWIWNLTASYTLPAMGTYTLLGFVTNAGKTEQEMSVVAPFGASTFRVDPTSLVLVLVVVVIVALLGLSVGNKKRAHRTRGKEVTEGRRKKRARTED